MEKKVIYSVAEAASQLPQKLSNQQLYSFLMEFGYVDNERRPSEWCIQKGFLVLRYGSMCKNSPKDTYPTAKFTKRGIRWVKKDLYPIIEKFLKRE